MPEQTQTLDVWLVEANNVYRDVPFTVVADWVQQGRLLDEDRVRARGSTEWTRVADRSALAAFLPRPEPHRVEDRAEALEPVELGFQYRRRPNEEDEDVDMIPLIDVSLVLLIFFIMTATVGSAASLIQTPQAKHGTHITSTNYWIGIDVRRDAEGNPLRDKAGNPVPVYSFGQGDKPPEPDAHNLPTRDAMLQILDRELQPGQRGEVRIKAHPLLPYEVVRDMTVVLEPRRTRHQISKVFAEVSEREQR